MCNPCELEIVINEDRVTESGMNRPKNKLKSGTAFIRTSHRSGRVDINYMKLGNELIVVRFFKNLLDIFAIICLLKETTKRFVLQLLRDILQSTQMIAWLIWRRNQHKEKLNRFAVKTFEVDACLADSDSSNRLANARVLGMRDSDSAADPGATQFFAFKNL